VLRWLVVPAGIKDEFAQQFAGGRVDDPDLKVLDKRDDAGSGVGSCDAAVVVHGVSPVSSATRSSLTTAGLRVSSRRTARSRAWSGYVEC